MKAEFIYLSQEAEVVFIIPCSGSKKNNENIDNAQSSFFNIDKANSVKKDAIRWTNSS